MQQGLVAGQIALSLALLTIGALFVRNASRVSAADLGLTVEGSLIASLDPSLAGYDEQQGRRLYRQLLERLRAALHSAPDPETFSG